MLQRTSLPSSSTAEIAESLQRSLNGRTWDSARWRSLQNLLPLPATWQQYLLACLALVLVFGGMLLHILLSVQIARTDFQLRQMREAYARIERQNSELVFQIAQRSSLAQMAELAAQKGYVPATGRTYVVRSSSALADPVAGEIRPPASASAEEPEQRASTGAGTSRDEWLTGVGDWWQETQQAVGATSSQLWRDITGRME